MSQHKRIFIIGHPGAGKGVLAKALAEKLNWQFVDADFGLEARLGLTLTEMMGKQGESAFHHCESAVLAALLQKDEIVVTTDASIVCDEKNRELLAKEFVIYLQVTTPVQLKRMSRNAEFLIPSQDRASFFDILHHERDSFYAEAATVAIDSDDNALEEHVLRIVNILLEDADIKPVGNLVTLDEKDYIIFHKSLHTPVHLSEQQALCLKLLAQGKSSKEIARDMNISHRTVENYIARTMERVGCTSSKELIALYHDQP